MDDQQLQEFLTTFTTLVKSNYDSNSTKNEQYALGLITAHQEVVKRNEILTRLFTEYVDRSQKRRKANDTMKHVSFGVFMTIVVALTLAVIVAFIRANLDTTSVATMATIISICVTYLGSIITIFQIIFKYLFPTDEEKDTISMIQTVIQNDIKVEELTSYLQGLDNKKEKA